ncbi:hypothetical protein BRADI_4g11564v3 [Brachypodium distachyon]|uniref:Knottin scorpion toxin-like domain-containing protein n=1 Tax=Brachypodium distachyon TaxID=15368 RepID=A0A2K2CM55_BRADI|nr:hypothetical protein BRADI_4g11564v3 [Brachypodium distachyon]
MATASFASVVCKILLIVATMVSLLSSAYAGDDEKYGKCFSRPDCRHYCKLQGYPKGGQVMPPDFQDCCCFK